MHVVAIRDVGMQTKISPHFRFLGYAVAVFPVGQDRVVLKVPNDSILSDGENRHRITKEAEVWTDLGLHPHVAYCYYVHVLSNVPLVVIEYLDGGNLRDWIADGKCADIKAGLDLAIQFCHALEHA